VEPDPDAVWLGFEGTLRSDAGTSTWAESTRQAKVEANSQALTISDMNNLINYTLIR